MNKDLKKIADHLIAALENRSEDFSFDGSCLTDNQIETDKLFYYPEDSNAVERCVYGEYMAMSTGQGLLDFGRIQGYRTHRAFRKWKKRYAINRELKKIRSVLKTLEEKEIEK